MVSRDGLVIVPNAIAFSIAIGELVIVQREDDHMDGLGPVSPLSYLAHTLLL
jgi:hypothetical protein